MDAGPPAIRALAHEMRERAWDVRATADRAVGRVERLPWRGLAAETARLGVRESAGDLRRAAALHDEAADALDRHARSVDDALELLAEAERKAANLLGDVVGGAISLVRDVA